MTLNWTSAEKSKLIFSQKSCNMLISSKNSSSHQIFSRRIAITIKQGDNVHHPIHGIGKVQSIRTRSFSGEKETQFAQVHFEREGLTLMLREEDLAETVRKPINAKEAKQLLKHLDGWDGKVRKEWKARANANQVAMEAGDPFAYADVYKGLSKLEAEGSLRATDREHMKKSLNLLVEEVSVALGETPEQALDQIASE